MKLLRQIAGGTLGVVAILALIMAIKTEIRKWVAFGGEEPDVARTLAWISWGTFLVSAFLAAAVWPKKQKAEADESNEQEVSSTP